MDGTARKGFGLPMLHEAPRLHLAELIRRARLFVGVDSGPAHLANAVGTFGILL